jgi:hypothetical protein
MVSQAGIRRRARYTVAEMLTSDVDPGSGVRSFKVEAVSVERFR